MLIHHAKLGWTPSQCLKNYRSFQHYIDIVGYFTYDIDKFNSDAVFGQESKLFWFDLSWSDELKFM